LAIQKKVNASVATRIADEREQRRGLILGLTLAEVLLLLLFLLLLVLGSQIRSWRERYETLVQTLDQLKPLQETLASSGVTDVRNVHELVTKFQALQASEKEISRLILENAELSKQSELTKSLRLIPKDGMSQVADVLKRASEIDPDDPPAFLKRSLDVMDRLGRTTTPEQVKPLTEMVPSRDLEDKLATLEADRDKIRRERDNLMRGRGNGLTYPSCWTTASGQTEYIFDVTLADAGVLVRNATPARTNDPAWTFVSQFARDTLVHENVFIGATKKLFEWSKGERCRFYAIVRDATGASKARYKHLQQLVQGNFYPLYLSPRQRPSDRTALPSPAAESNAATQ
jgi:hypothetical protein